ENNKLINSHYCYIKNLSRFLNVKNKIKGIKKICPNCRNCFNIKKYKNHYKLCVLNEPTNIILPETDNDATIKFKNIHKELVLPIRMYCDIECVLQDFTDENEKYLKMKRVQKHVISGLGCYIINNNKGSYHLFNTGEEFIKFLITNESKYYEIINSNKKPIITDEDLKKCNDHCHISGKYKAALCNKCNLHKNYKEKIVSILFHNSSKYDNHIILKSIAKTCLNKYKNGEIMINCIPDNSETYKCFELKV